MLRRDYVKSKDISTTEVIINNASTQKIFILSTTVLKSIEEKFFSKIKTHLDISKILQWELSYFNRNFSCKTTARRV